MAQTSGSFGRLGRKIGFPQRVDVLARAKGIKSVVLLEVAYDASGKAEELSVSDLSPFMDRALIDASPGPVKTWTCAPERIAGKGVASRALVPICFIANKRKPDQEECKLPSDLGGGPFETGSSIALESRVTLKSDVIGRTL